MQWLQLSSTATVTCPLNTSQMTKDRSIVSNSSSAHYKETVSGKYVDTTATILAGLSSELRADAELSGCSLESESELDQEKVQPTMEESGIESVLGEQSTDASDKESTNASNGEDTNMSDKKGTDASDREDTDGSHGEDLKKIRRCLKGG